MGDNTVQSAGEAFNSAVQWAGDSAKTIAACAVAHGQSIGEFTVAAARAGVEIVQTIDEGISEACSDIGNAFEDAYHATVEAIEDGVDAAAEWHMDAADWVDQAIENAVETITDV